MVLIGNCLTHACTIKFNNEASSSGGIPSHENCIPEHLVKRDTEHIGEVAFAIAHREANEPSSFGIHWALAPVDGYNTGNVNPNHEKQ